MRKNGLLRKLGIVALVVFAIGAIGYVAGGRDGTSNNTVGLGTNDAGFANGGFRSVVPSEESAASMPPFVDSKGEMDTPAPALRDGAAPAGSTGMGPTPGGALVSGFDRKIVQTASMQLQVEDVGGSFEEVGRIASAAGGFVASSSFSYRGEQQIASVTIRVPSERYHNVLASLRGLGVRVDAENSDAQDVTEEYTDLGSRRRNLEATEAQLLSLLNRAETIGDILTVQDRLNQVRYEIEYIQGRIQMLDNMSDLATITVHLRPEGDTPFVTRVTTDRVDLRAEISEAWDASLRFLGNIAAGVITVVVFAWWVPIVAIPALILFRLTTRNRPRPIESVD